MRDKAEITKVGLAAVESGRLLVVRKRGKPSFILPGGKPEAGEDEIAALAREIDEELGCKVACLNFEGRFADKAADLPGTNVVVVLYAGTLSGMPRPQSEIEEMAWIEINKPSHLVLAPSIVNYILPHLQMRFGVKRRSSSRSKLVCKST